MAQITFFHYVNKDTLLHRMDGRLKLLGLLLLSISVSLASEWLHFLILLGVLIVSFFVARLPIVAVLKDLKLFSLIIVLVFIVDALIIPGDPLPFFTFSSISLQGVMAGLLFAGRLILIIALCAVMMGTTPLSVLRNAVEWCLRPVPFISEAQVAVMINLTFVFVTVIMDTYTEMMYAQQSRCIQLRKNPVIRIKYIAFPLFNRTLQKADEIVQAMEARCYSEERTQAEFATSMTDWIAAIVCLAVLLGVIFV